MNNHNIHPEIIPEDTPINAINIKSFKHWLLYHLVNNRYAPYDLIFGKSQNGDNGILESLDAPIRETDLYLVYSVQIPKFDEKISIIKEKATGNLFYFATDKKAQPQMVLMEIISKYRAGKKLNDPDVEMYEEFFTFPVYHSDKIVHVGMASNGLSLHKNNK